MAQRVEQEFDGHIEECYAALRESDLLLQTVTQYPLDVDYEEMFHQDLNSVGHCLDVASWALFQAETIPAQTLTQSSCRRLIAIHRAAQMAHSVMQDLFTDYCLEAPVSLDEMVF